MMVLISFRMSFREGILEEGLLKILRIRDLLADVRIVLILPDRRKETIAAGYKLYPRFLTFMDSDPRELAAVLEKMIENCYKPGRMMEPYPDSYEEGYAMGGGN